MGQATNALLFYGVLLEEGGAADSMIHGIKECIDDDEGYADEDNELHRLLYFGVAGEKGFPVDIVKHCSLTAPMYALAARASLQTARRGYPEKARWESVPLVLIEWEREIRDFCERNLVPLSEKPDFRWWLASWWEA